MMLRAYAQNYLKNRTDFYSALLPRIPHLRLRELLEQAVQPVSGDDTLISSLGNLPSEEPSEFVSALGLRDLLKKPNFGAAWGKTTISFEEALARSEIVEETGMILFRALGASFESEAVRREAALAEVLRLTDDLRYHKLPL